MYVCFKVFKCVQMHMSVRMYMYDHTMPTNSTEQIPSCECGSHTGHNKPSTFYEAQKICYYVNNSQQPVKITFKTHLRLLKDVSNFRGCPTW
jgi:hypothetical protein